MTNQAQGLYDPSNEHDACGVGFVAHIKGKKTHDIVQGGLKILANIDHRGAVGADPLMGDGAGILIQIPDSLYREELAAQGVLAAARPALALSHRARARRSRRRAYAGLRGAAVRPCDAAVLAQ